MLRVIAATMITAAALAVTPAQAHADQFDYIAAVDSAGVSYSSILDMMDLGKGICHALRAGVAPASVVAAVQHDGWSPYESGLIIGAAANGMCPDTWPVLNQFVSQSIKTNPTGKGYVA